MPTIVLASAYDSITLYGDDPYASGFTYRNDTLSSWYELPDVASSEEARPNDFGSFGWERIYPGAAKPKVTGTYWGTSYLEAAVARRRLTGLYAAGAPITMTVMDELGTFSRSVNVVAANVPWTSTAIFEYTLGLVAVDPRRYGVTQTYSTGLPPSATGLIWPLGSAQATYSWQGTPNLSASMASVYGSVTRTNYSTNPNAESGTTTGYTANAYGPTGTLSTTTERFHSGTRSFKYVAAGGGNGEGIAFTIPSGQRYASVWVYNPSSGGVDHLGITGLPNGQSQTTVTRTTLRDQWTRLSIDMLSTVGGQVVVYNDDTAASAGSTFYWDDVLIGDTGDYFDGSSGGGGGYFNWGSAGASGIVAFTNTGNAPSAPMFTVAGGTVANGFSIVEIETGRTLTYGSTVNVGESIALIARTKTVTINGSGNFTQRLTSRRWPSIPPKATRTYLFTPLGSATGAPTLSMQVATADL